MWLIAGLGNPGPGYEKTRHNLGFMALEALSRRLRIPLRDYDGRLSLGRGHRRGEEILLARPLGFMNLSGEILAPLAHRERVETERILVMVDDLDLPLGTLRYRPGGGTGGHRGLESMVRCLGSDAFRRIRLGIGRPDEPVSEADYVLSPFRDEEMAMVERVLGAAADLAGEVIFGGKSTPGTVKLTEDQNKEGL
ncbi:MAG: aminoacyl-tRNA hydrolase [Proteobacteria bacterium]|nr:aminoacyl-tRNA hydrolase [Pseudomonadota bacterium]